MCTVRMRNQRCGFSLTPWHQRPGVIFLSRGRPKMLYLDNGPVAKSLVFQNMMQSLKVDWLTHTPAGKDGTRTTARSKGKVERSFMTVKEAHETQ